MEYGPFKFGIVYISFSLKSQFDKNICLKNVVIEFLFIRLNEIEIFKWKHFAIDRLGLNNKTY